MNKTHEQIVADSMAAIVWNYNGEDITRGELWALHKRVENPKGWKFHIDAIIDELTPREEDLLVYALGFFSGCEAEFYAVEGQPNKVNVVADGYYMSIGS
jgi:hypothetical protein